MLIERSKRKGLLVLLAISSTAAACADFREAIVTNPCNHLITVRFSQHPPDQVETFHPSPFYKIEPLSARRIDSVLQGPGESSYSAQIIIDEQESVIEIERAEEEPIPVVVPARLCRS